MFFTDKDVLVEGSRYNGVWLETQPMGGEMYAKRNMAVALNNQLIFMENQKKTGRMPGLIWYEEGRGSLVFYDWLQGFCFPVPALRMYYLIGHDKKYLGMLYQCLKEFDEYLWTYRDSDGDGCLETWCTWDTGEDFCTRFTAYGAPDGKWGGEEPPKGVGRLPYASMDVMSYSCQAREVLGRISDLLNNGKGDFWRAGAQAVRDKIRDYLWIDGKNACYDRDCNGEIMDILLHNNLRCMYFGSFSQDMADRFLKYHLFNPEEFWTYLPLPSIAVNDPMFRNTKENNWSGRPEGLTYQRAILALEQYGHMAEIRILGRKWLEHLMRVKRLVQQFDPFTGEPCADREGNTPPDGYGPTILSALEYLSLISGVNIAEDRAQWSAVRDWPDGSYVQEMFGHAFELRWQDDRMRAFIDGRQIFACSAGVSITTDLSGKILWIWGIDGKEQEIELEYGSERVCGCIRPNRQLVLCGEGFREIRQVAYDVN